MTRERSEEKESHAPGARDHRRSLSLKAVQVLSFFLALLAAVAKGAAARWKPRRWTTSRADTPTEGPIAALYSVPFHRTATLWMAKAQGEGEHRRKLWEKLKLEHEHHRKWSRYSRHLNDDDGEGGSTNSSKAHVSPLYHGIGTHFVYLWVGYPEPQRVSLIVDTGSHKTAFPCAGCHHCGATFHTDHHFDPSQSTTFHRHESCDECRFHSRCQNQHSAAAQQCIVEQRYKEGSSWTAHQATDQVTLGDFETPGSSGPFEFTFGCQVSVKGELFVQQLADGISGFSLHDGQDTLPQQMFEAGLLRKPKFSLCFQGLSHSDSDGDQEMVVDNSFGGILTLGGTARERHATPMVFARNTHGKQGLYAVKVKRVYFETPSYDKPQVLPVSLQDLNQAHGVILDSGTTDSYFPPSFGHTFRMNAWKKGHYSDVKGVQLTAEDLRELPTLLMQVEAFTKPSNGTEHKDVDYDIIPGYVGTSLDPRTPQDVIIEITPDAYMEYDPQEKKYFGRLHFNERRGAVLGANALQGYDVLFSSTKLGFAKSDCSRSHVDKNTGDKETTMHMILKDDDDNVGLEDDDDKSVTTTKEATSEKVGFRGAVMNALGIGLMSAVTLVFVASMISGLVARYRRHLRLTGYIERPSTRDYSQLHGLETEDEDNFDAPDHGCRNHQGDRDEDSGRNTRDSRQSIPSTDGDVELQEMGKDS